MARFLFNPFTKKLDETSTSGGGGGGISTLTGNSGGAIGPTAGNINIVGSGAITVSGNPGTSTLTITSGNPFFIWQVITASQTAVTQNGYFCNGASRLQITLPSPANIGDVFELADISGNGWQITQPGNQQIRMGTDVTTVGASGSVVSNEIGDTIELVCYDSTAAAERWLVVDSIGTSFTFN